MAEMGMPRRWLLIALLAAGCAGSGSPPAGPPPAPPDPQGTWRGAVVYRPAEVEVDVTVDLSRRSDSSWAGLIDVPVQRLEDQPLRNLRVDGSEVSFELFAGNDVSAFQARLSADGRTLQGWLTESGESHPFTLERLSSFEPASRPGPDLCRLSDSGEELTALFDEEADKVRLLLLISPT